MFALLQIYPLEANADDGSDDNCCLDVIAIDTTEARLKRFLADYEPTYREAVAASTPGTTTHPRIGARSMTARTRNVALRFEFTAPSCEKPGSRSSRLRSIGGLSRDEEPEPISSPASHA
jgi:hypothetical protein